MKSFIQSALFAILGFATLRMSEEGGGAQPDPTKGPTSASGRIKIAEKDYDEETGVFSIVFSDGSASEIALSEFSEKMQRNLALHGLAQKLGDSYASVKGDVVEGKKRFEAVLTQLLNDEWKKTREGGEGAARSTELAEAISRIRGADIAKCNIAVSKATKEQIAAWKANAKIKAEIAKIRAEKAAARAEKAGKDAQAEGAATDEELAALDLDAIAAQGETA